MQEYARVVVLVSLFCRPQAFHAPATKWSSARPGARCSAILSCDSPPVSVSDQEAVSQTKAWISEFIIKLNICPFAKKVFADEGIRYVVSGADDEERLLEHFLEEADDLLDLEEDDVATTILIAPQYKSGVDRFHGLSLVVEELLEDEDAGILPAFFHPQWTFEGLPEQDALHFEKRAPFPTINILRSSQVQEAIEERMERGVILSKEISEHNSRVLDKAGFQTLQRLFEEQILQTKH